MGKLFCVMGKSASGKDSIYKELLQQKDFPLANVVPYTTRPIRAGEIDGKSYHFCTREQAMAMQEEGKVIELRTYQTVHGPWDYFTADDGQIDLEKKNSLLIVTLEGYLHIRNYFGAKNVVPIYIEVEDGERLSRALAREKLEKEPKYAEMCRRFLADSEDFAESKIKEAQITKRFINQDKGKTIKEILDYMRQC